MLCWLVREERIGWNRIEDDVWRVQVDEWSCRCSLRRVIPSLLSAVHADVVEVVTRQ